MKKLILILLIGILIMSCSMNEKEFEGDLYFKLIDIGSFYGVDDKRIEQFEKSFDSIRWSKTAGKDELEIIRVFDVLKTNDLLKAPWIHIKTEFDIRKIYLSEKEYYKLKKFNRNELVKDNKKVNLKLLVEELDSGIYYLNKISKLKLVKGKTYWRK